MVNICILGATGSIGSQALEIIRSREDLRLHSFSYHSNDEKAQQVVREYKPVKFLKTDSDASRKMEDLASDDEVDVVLHSVSGTLGIRAAISALRAGKTLALANKETLVAAGDLVMREKCGKIIPVDSEHSAIYQCLGCSLDARGVRKIVLTASGGPFRERSVEEIAAMKASDALRHPTWNMGRKITVDSATMMNKGLEIIEAMHLFQLPLSKIEVLIHPESIVHSMVCFEDHSFLAELSKPSMHQPIALALTGEKKYPNPVLDLAMQKTLTFQNPDPERFPCLALAMEAARAGGILPAVMNAANEVAVEAFLNDRIGFYDISNTVKEVMDRTESVPLCSPEHLEEVISRAENMAKNYILRIG